MKRTIVAMLAVALTLASQLAQAQETSVLVPTRGNGVASLLLDYDARLQHSMPATTSELGSTASFVPLPKYGRWVGITKWITLGAAVGLGTLGFALHADANEMFDELEALCEADADNCRSRTASGAYADTRLEQLYQDVLSRDRQARLSLIGAEVNFGLSVLLFIVDFQRDRGPSDIPYDPDEQKTSNLRLTAVPGEVALRYYFR